jgi:hypothetical protein
MAHPPSGKVRSILLEPSARGLSNLCLGCVTNPVLLSHSLFGLCHELLSQSVFGLRHEFASIRLTNGGMCACRALGTMPSPNTDGLCHDSLRTREERLLDLHKTHELCRRHNTDQLRHAPIENPSLILTNGVIGSCRRGSP